MKLPAEALGSDASLTISYAEKSAALPDLPADRPKVAIVQRLALAEPAVVRRYVEEATRRGLLDAADGGIVTQAHRLDSDVLQVIRLAVAGPFDPAKAGVGLRRRIARAADLPDFAGLEAHLRATAAQVRAVFDRAMAGA